MVVNPGWWQVADTLLVFAGTSGVAFAFFGRFTRSRVADLLMRLLLGLLALVVLLFPDGESGSRIMAAIVGQHAWLAIGTPAAAIPIAAGVLVAGALTVGIQRHRLIAQATAPVSGGDRGETAPGAAAPLLAEARREV
jgi:hypothetical protein